MSFIIFISLQREEAKELDLNEAVGGYVFSYTF